MRIAAYNVWNSDTGMPKRENQVIEEINDLDLDIVALQEVRNSKFNERIIEETSFENHCFIKHEGRVVEVEPWRVNEGLSVYSKYPIKYTKYIEYALIVVIEHKDNLILLVNVHLPWDSVIAQEECIINIIKEISTFSPDYRFILGDFNCSEMSSVQQFIKGLRSLKNTEVNHYWTDLSLVAEEFLGVKKEMTLDLSDNPRWEGKPLTDNSARVDCIFIHDCFPKLYPVLRSLKYFGKEVNEETGYCASDHYGVFVEIQMPYEKL